LDDVAVRAGHKALRKLAFISLIVGNAQGILDQQLRPHPINIPNIIAIVLLVILLHNNIKLLIKIK
jgi:hypothetical protein